MEGNTYHCGTYALVTFAGRLTTEFRCTRCGDRWEQKNKIKPRETKRERRERRQERGW